MSLSTTVLQMSRSMHCIAALQPIGNGFVCLGYLFCTNVPYKRRPFTMCHLAADSEVIRNEPFRICSLCRFTDSVMAFSHVVKV